MHEQMDMEPCSMAYVSYPPASLTLAAHKAGLAQHEGCTPGGPLIFYSSVS